MPCGWGEPDNDEPDNNLWESATPYGYGLWIHRTFWNPAQPAGLEWSDPNWYQWDVEWTGQHWLWVEGLDPGTLRVMLFVYKTTGDVTLGPLELLAWGEAYRQGDLGVFLKAGKTYYVEAVNLTWQVGCYDIWLEP